MYLSILLWVDIWVVSHLEPLCIMPPSLCIFSPPPSLDVLVEDLPSVPLPPAEQWAGAVRAWPFLCQCSSPRSHHAILFANLLYELISRWLGQMEWKVITQIKSLKVSNQQERLVTTGVSPSRFLWQRGHSRNCHPNFLWLSGTFPISCLCHFSVSCPLIVT